MLYRRLIIEWVIVAVFATLAIFMAIERQLLRPLDNILLDGLSAFQPIKADPRIVLVEIDDASLKSLGPWPWPRSVHATFLDRITTARPAAIGYDVLFLEPTSDDVFLAEAMRRARPVYLPMLPPRAGQDTTAATELPQPVIADAATGFGSVDMISDPDGIVRHFHAGVEHYPLLVERLASQLGYKPRPTTEPASILTFAPADGHRAISFSDIMSGAVSTKELSGKVIIVGGTATGFGDRFPVPAYAGSLQSGIGLQANIIDNLVNGHLRQELPLGWQYLLSLGPAWLLLIAFLRFSPGINFRLSLLALAFTALIATGLLLWRGLWFPPAAALLGLGLVYSLWGWRRLSAVSAYLTQEVKHLRAEPDLAPIPQNLSPRGDKLNVDANRLHTVIGQLRTMRAFIADVIARLPDALCVLDDAGTVLMGNLAADALFGGSVRGQAMSELLGRISRGRPEHGSEISLPDGRTFVLSRAALPSGGAIVRLADVSALHRASAEREAALGFLSHDMRAPHAAIIALLDSHGPGADRAALPETIRLHAERGLKLADDFVELARLERAAIDLHPVDLCGCAAEAIDLIYPHSRRRRITIREENLDVDLWVIGDEALLIRAILNLLDNAVKFSPEGGIVTCSVTGSVHEAVLTVSNAGPPMPVERMADPFLSFAPGRDTNDRSSHGLGLAFVKASAERQEGRVSYREDSDGMKYFSITLALADPLSEGTTEG